MNNTVIALIAKKTVPTLTRRINRGKLITKKQSPHIFFGLGLAGSVTSTVLACRATLNLHDTLEEIELDVRNIKKLRAEHLSRADESIEMEHYSPEQLNKDATYVYAKAVYKIGKLYGPAVGVGIVSVSLLTGAHVSLSRRNTALMAAYATVMKAYDDYRERIIQELGAERELDIRHAKIASNVTPDGEEVKVNDPNSWSPYARFFDEGSAHWEKNAEFNRLFVQCQQNYANELLRARGHVFLNEVYDSLGIDRSKAGAVVGWVISKTGDNFIDFGMYEAVNSQFINGWERSILLDFNVDGVIYDKI
jgi:hypothetical protein